MLCEIQDGLKLAKSSGLYLLNAEIPGLQHVLSIQNSFSGHPKTLSQLFSFKN